MSIEDSINTLIDEFSISSRGLFEVTGRSIVHFEQGLYGCAIAKPSKRMRNILAVDRELLVVVSTFTDQQQRTIKFTRQHIDNSQGRFEPTVALIMHLDRDGNTKLKNWGRDQGLSILPLYCKSKLSKGEELEHQLCYELYSHDPFDVTGPVSDDANFFGRRDEAIDLARKLQRGQIRSCLGIRKVGKTSIINRIIGEIRENYTCICLMIDCSRDDVWKMNAAQLLAAIGDGIERAVEANDHYLSIEADKSDVELSEARVKMEASLSKATDPVIAVFDEVDYITPGSPTNAQWREDFNSFWRNLRAVYQESQRRNRIMSILVSGVSTYWFTVESINGIENAALSFIPEEYLSPLPFGATVAMLRKLGRVAGFQIDDSVAALVAETTSNMPYWTRKSCSYVHRNIPITQRPCLLTVDQVRPLLEAFIKEEGAAFSEVALRHLFKVHPELLEATTKCNAGDSKAVSERLKRVLRRYGVLASHGEGLSGSMIKVAFQTIVHPDLTRDGVLGREQPAPRGDEIGLDEWADEIAVLGKRRNIVEKRLRDIALNFIRFDSVSAGKAPEIRERISSILPERQKASMKHLTADEVIGRFTWTDLVKLVVKEWMLFNRLFGDQVQFRQNCELINDRFDAHAKPADAADFALYRRALSYIEERLARIQ